MFIVTDEVEAYGHPNISATHKTTFEITKEKHLTEKGTCIIGISANKGARDLSEQFKRAAKKGCRIRLTLIVEDYTEDIYGYGHPNLTFTHPTDLVGRKSSYICPRTIMINADKSAMDINRNIIQLLKHPCTKMKLLLAVET
ncbi:MAG: DUF371 domain-containing protein [Candidatus Odinarchaeia archaeon]